MKPNNLTPSLIGVIAQVVALVVIFEVVIATTPDNPVASAAPVVQTISTV